MQMCYPASAFAGSCDCIQTTRCVCVCNALALFSARTGWRTNNYCSAGSGALIVHIFVFRSVATAGCGACGTSVRRMSGVILIS